MDDLWAMLGALATVVLPIVLAGWLLGRPSKPQPSRDDPHGKISGKEDR